MGWTGLHREKGLTNREFFEREFPNTLTVHGKVVADATVKGVYYAAVKGTADDPDKVWALVVLTRRAPRSYYNFLYKELDEDMGPGDAFAPAKVLDALTPTDNEWALAWREACRANLARAEKFKTVRVGDVVTFERPIEFADGATFKRLVLVDRKSNTFRPVEGEGYGRYHFPRWKEAAAA